MWFSRKKQSDSRALVEFGDGQMSDLASLIAKNLQEARMYFGVPARTGNAVVPRYLYDKVVERHRAWREEAIRLRNELRGVADQNLQVARAETNLKVANAAVERLTETLRSTRIKHDQLVQRNDRQAQALKDIDGLIGFDLLDLEQYGDRVKAVLDGYSNAVADMNQSLAQYAALVSKKDLKIGELTKELEVLKDTPFGRRLKAAARAARSKGVGEAKAGQPAADAAAAAGNAPPIDFEAAGKVHTERFSTLSEALRYFAKLAQQTQPVEHDHHRLADDGCPHHD